MVSGSGCLARSQRNSGFKCSEDQFTCKNGECIKRNLLCDGDFACKDHSDEENCGCYSSMFACKEGECHPATAVCNGYEDCSGGDDESNCRSTRCNLNDLACTSKDPTGQNRCRSFRGNCNFQTSRCGLNPDKNATFQWTVDSGQTPTEGTGPSYDHTSFSKDGERERLDKCYFPTVLFSNRTSNICLSWLSLTTATTVCITPKLDVVNYTSFPLDVVVLSSDAEKNARKIYLIDRGPHGQMMSLNNHRNDSCCGRKIVFSFYALNVSEPGGNITFGCEPGWYRAGISCFLFYKTSTLKWSDARTFCHRSNADFAYLNDASTMDAIANRRRELKFDTHGGIFLGLTVQSTDWLWIDGQMVSNTNNLWGPGEPSGDGKCGTFLNAIGWSSDWVGYGWRWNDQPCNSLKGYICEQPLDVPMPVAIFTLRGANGTVDLSRNGATKAKSNNITFEPGPCGNPNGSFFFSGMNDSFVHLENNGELDTRLSTSILAWVYLQNSTSFIYKYETVYNFSTCSLIVVPQSLGVQVTYIDRKTLKEYSLHKKNILNSDKWNFIGTTYDYHTGIATIFVNNSVVTQKVLKVKMELGTASEVLIGGSTRSNKFFRGRISCLQVYDQALSVDQIIKVKSRCNQTAQFECGPNFFHLYGGCFSIHTQSALSWKDAQIDCSRKGGTLAKVSREGLRSALSNKLEAMKPKPDTLHIGFSARYTWVWIDGNPLNASLWMRGYPSGDHGHQSCVVLSANSSRIKNEDCKTYRNALCSKRAEKLLSRQNLPQSSSVLLPNYPYLAIDRSFSTCFRSKKESSPWWKVTLEKPLYVESVEITENHDCCPRDNGILSVGVSTDETSLHQSCTESVSYGKSWDYKVRCSPPARGRYVTFKLIGSNVTLVLCQVAIRTIEFTSEIHGVWRDAWYNVNYDSKKASTMRENPAFQDTPQSQIILRDFDAPVNVAENYIQRLTGYLQVPESGNYTFYVACDDLCELWIHDVTEDCIETVDRKSEKTVSRQPIITIERWTGHQQWDKFLNFPVVLGFKCSEDQFTCKNGECVKRNLLCDGDFACKDHSDEENCECPSSKFSCKGGGCLLTTAVCNDYEDCSSGDDESNCQNPCPSSHQCLDGSCIPWSDTCSETPFCRDGTNAPSICVSARCKLNDLACTSETSTGQKRCRSFRGNCNFQTSRCGLKPDKNATFQWTVGSHQTLTEGSGPSYDHTSFSKDGFYIYIEASRRNFGDEARLLSDWMKPNETVCVKFWYHMHGSDIGNLSIYLKTNQSETLVWMVSGDQGNRWRYGQTALNSTLWFKFVLEGAVGTGSKGDIAVDDFTVVDGACEKIFKQTSPDCYFEESGCDWYVHDGGVLNTHLAGMGKRGYASLPVGASEPPCFLSSSIINSIAYEWNCLRFWRKASLTVLLNNTKMNKTQLLFHAEEATNMWRYVQLPIPINSTQIQIHFVGVCKFTHGPFVDIANVSFTKEPCKLIPWSAGKDCQKPLGMENGAISNEQITASSQWNAYYAPSQGRLHSKQSGVKWRSWSASVNDNNQWLQVALEIQYMKITAVATQGLSEYSEWVTKYKLQYSGDGISFQYYKEPEDIEEKVILEKLWIKRRNEVITGDLNCDSTCLTDGSISSTSGQKLQDLLSHFNYTVINDKPTRVTSGTSTLIDQVISSNRNLIKNTRTIELGISDHMLVHASVQTRIKRPPTLFSLFCNDLPDIVGNCDGDIHLHADETTIYAAASSPDMVAVVLNVILRKLYNWCCLNRLIPHPVLNQLDDSPCDISQDWCGWKSIHGWKSLKNKDLDYIYQNESGDTGNDKQGGVGDSVHSNGFGGEIPMGVADDMWHHVCVLWNNRKRLMQVFKDGERRYSSFESHFTPIEVEGTMTIGFRNHNDNASIALGVLSGFNLWGHPMPVEEILRMSFGCDSEDGDVKAWKTVRKGLQKEVEVKLFPTCSDRGGGRLVVDTNVSHFTQLAVLMRPLYNRSHDWPSECLKFRYMFRGPGKKTLTIYQKTKTYRKIPIWISGSNTGKNWLYGQVPLNSLSEFQ
ncbi:uncharacterized protein LOC111347272, partial [Stylophora pistillata]|uniref:uncharacterized protein LOC111347272 n=1 Tax=Stylophora pistillata TaxID=50429 RepID=UPI000C039854